MGQAKATKETKIIVTLWDGDVYILEGYKSAAEAEEKLQQFQKVEMPNGDVIKTSAIAKVQTRESYHFQAEQKKYHKKGYHMRNGEWHDDKGSLGIKANLQSITGKAKLSLPSSTVDNLPAPK